MYPEFVEVAGKKIKINTSYKTAIKCQEIATRENIGDYERALAIIYVLYGDAGLDLTDNYEELLLLAKKYLSCGKEIESSNEEPDMDYTEDMDYIKASFRTDYNIDLNKEDMHWWEFYNLINGLSNSELGNCCVLNRIRNLRNYDTKDIKDPKEKAKIEKAKEQVALKKHKKGKHFTEEQKRNIDRFYELSGINRKE